MSFLEPSLAKLTIKLLGNPQQPTVPGFPNGKLEVRFNPTEYGIDRETSFAEVAIPGLDAPVLQYVRGNGSKMTFELFLDVTDSMKDGEIVTGQSVRELYIRPLEQLMLQHSELHAPPPVAIFWGNKVVFDSAVAVSLSVKYVLFDSKGEPVRATASLSLREHKPATKQLAEAALQSPDKANLATVRAGDTLPAIAFREYGNASLWRPIAIENGLSNPLALVPGQSLVVPKVV